MAFGLGRGLLTPLVLLIFLLTVIELALAGWAWNRNINGNNVYGNAATPTFVVLALISGVVGMASLFASSHHLRVWRPDSMSAASGTALIDLMLSLLLLGVAAKEIHIGGRDRRLRALEAFVIMLAVLKLFKVLALHTVGDKYGTNNHTTTTGHHGLGDHHKGTPAASAV